MRSKPVRYGTATLGVILSIWKPFWGIVSAWSNIDFVSQKTGVLHALWNFLLGPTGGNLSTIVGMLLILAAFIMVERSKDIPHPSIEGGTTEAALGTGTIVAPGFEGQPKGGTTEAALGTGTIVAPGFEGQPKGAPLCCIWIGMSHVSLVAKKVWTANGSVSAAVAIFKNMTQQQVRSAKGTAHYYDDNGREIDFSVLPWLDETYDNTGFSASQERVLVLAVQKDGSSGHFSTPLSWEGTTELLATAVTAKVTVHHDDPSGYEQYVFNLRISPYLDVSLKKAEKRP
jgi:hypothetical protein